MPELPEVETVCRIMRRALLGKTIRDAEVAEDSIVLSGLAADVVKHALVGSSVLKVGRKGKFWWLELDSGQSLCGHLGMSGWIREIGKEGGRLLEHGSQPLDDPDGRPKFLKLRIVAEDGAQIVFTDGRRLGRLWLAENPSLDKRIVKLGPDALDDLPSAKRLAELFAKRSAPVKALLLDQGLISGIGNYLADEILYMAGVAPKRPANSLSTKEIGALRRATEKILEVAVASEADFARLPETWLVHHRWGGKRGASQILGEAIVRETVGGRTTAWVPSKQR
jgi:formamidopyrimidine-DNA glycosylase